MVTRWDDHCAVTLERGSEDAGDRQLVMSTVFMAIPYGELDSFPSCLTWSGPGLQPQCINVAGSLCDVWVKWVLVTQLCLTFCDPMDCSPPDSSVHGILQASIVECDSFPILEKPLPSPGSLPDPGIKPILDLNRWQPCTFQRSNIPSPILGHTCMSNGSLYSGASSGGIFHSKLSVLNELKGWK